MSLAEDVPILAGVFLILSAIVVFVGVFVASGLPGLGSFDNPIDEILSQPGGDKVEKYDVTTQINVGTTALGDTEVGDFTYQTQPSCNLCLSIGSSDSLSFTGAENVKADVRIVNQDTGKVYVQTTKFIDELEGGETVSVNTNFNNAEPGNYLARYIVTYDPEAFDLTDVDNVKRVRENFEVPKIGGVQ